MDFKKIYSPRAMHTFQVIALTGLVMTAIAQFVLVLTDRQIPDFELLYLCWLVLFIFGLMRNFTAKPPEDDHHHH